MKTLATVLMTCLFLACGAVACGGVQVDEPTDVPPDPAHLESADSTANLIALGQHLFNDTSLSEPAGEACATCHDPKHFFIDTRLGPDGQVTPTSPGAVAGLFGPRNAPSILYASFIPPLTGNDTAGFEGGLFWDGRAISLAAQSQSPVLNPIEMGNPDATVLVGKIQKAPYAALFKTVFGAKVFGNVTTAFNDMATAIAAYETGAMPARFTSKYDAYLAGKYTLTAAEAAGLAVFNSPQAGGCLDLPPEQAPPMGNSVCGCAQCHIDTPGADGSPPLFVDYGYDNLGIPKNPANPYYKDPAKYNPAGAGYIDHGLSAPIHDPRQDGKFRAQTLRNIAMTAPYGHNGYFPDLASIVHFYNTRDVPGAGWPPPEVSFDINTTNLGNLGLSATDEANLVAFMETLTDGYIP